MSYQLAVEQLYARGHELAPSKPGMPRPKFDLAYMRVLMKSLGDPQASFRSVLIAGTNGKGSTAATLASVVQASGYRTGLYTSPHLERINERIRIGGAQVSDDDFARLYFAVDDAANRLVTSGDLPHLPSFFEVMTAIAFLYFAEQKVDLAVLEVGLGGRLDATNIVEPLVSVITDLGLDHMDYLGPTLTHIAKEKAGILRRNGVMVTLPQHPEANYALGEVAVPLEVRGVNAAAYIPDRSVNFNQPPDRVPHSSATRMRGMRNVYPLQVLGEAITVDSPLGGAHQQRNLALAVATAVELHEHHGFTKVTAATIAEGIRSTAWPGRLERITSNGAEFLLDVAHNPDGAWTLRSALGQLPDEQPRTLVFSCLKDKAIDGIAQTLFPLFDATADRPQDHIVLTTIHNPRAASLTDLEQAAARMDVPATSAPDVAAAIERARALTPAGGLIVMTGSVYLIGEGRSLLFRNR